MANSIEILLKKYEQNYGHHNICIHNYHKQTDYLIAYLTILGAIAYNLLIGDSLKNSVIPTPTILAGALVLSISIFFFLMSNMMDALFGIYRLSSILEVLETKIDQLAGLKFNATSINMNQLHRENKFSPALTWGFWGLAINILILAIHIYLSVKLTSSTFSIIYILLVILINALMSYQWGALKKKAKKYTHQIEELVEVSDK